MNLVIFSHLNIRFEKRFEEPNDGVYLEELSRSPSCGAGNSICTRYLLCLKDLIRTSPPAPGLKRTGIRLRSVNPYHCPNSGVRAYRAESRAGSHHCFA
jgi:hypothetical protein